MSAGLKRSCQLYLLLCREGGGSAGFISKVQWLFCPLWIFEYGEKLQIQSDETLQEAVIAIIIRLDRMMADRKMSLNELSERVGAAAVNLSKIKTGKISAERFSALDAVCDILEFQKHENKDIGEEK